MAFSRYLCTVFSPPLPDSDHPDCTKRDFSVLLILRCASFTRAKSRVFPERFISYASELRNFHFTLSRLGFWVIEHNGFKVNKMTFEYLDNASRSAWILNTVADHSFSSIRKIVNRIDQLKRFFQYFEGFCEAQQRNETKNLNYHGVCSVKRSTHWSVYVCLQN